MRNAIRLSLAGARTWAPLFFLTPTILAQDVCLQFPGRVFDGGPTPAAIEAADMDGDGDLDLVVGSACAPLVRVLHNDGHGRFETHTDVATFGLVFGIAVGDLDGDLDPDVVAIESSSGFNVDVLENQSGTLVLTQHIVANARGPYPALGDLDGDGDVDLVMTTSSMGAPSIRGLTVWMSEAAGFGAPTLYPLNAGEDALESAFGDFDGDGDLDVSTTAGAGAIKTWLNEGRGSLVRAADIVLPDNRRLVAADLDRDGIDDRIVTRVVTRDVAVLLSTRASPVLLPTFSLEPYAVRVVDIDADGILDLRVLAARVHDFLVDPDCEILPSVSRPVPAGSRLLAVGDFDGDGVPDSAAANYGTDALAMHVTAAEHSYVPPPTLAIDQTLDAEFVDLDQDGDLDVVSARGTSVRVMVRQSSGPMSYGPVLPGADHARAVQVIAGGAPELVLYSASSTTVRVFVGDAAVGYGEVAAPSVGLRPHSLAAGDVHGDGHVDLVLGAGPGSAATASISVLTGIGDGTFPVSTLLTLPGAAFVVRLADVDGDADLDLLAAVQSSQDFPIWLFLNDGQGSFGTPVQIADHTSAGGLFAVGDLDLDGDMDVVTAANGTRELRVFANDGLGTFGLAACIAAEREITGLALGRVDADGASDLATVETSSPAILAGMLVGVWKNRLDRTFERQSLHGVGPLQREVRIADWTGDGRNDVIVLHHTATVATGAWVLANAGGCATGSSLCSGDGTASPCPCGNAGAAGHGCASSFDTAGAELAGEGDASVQADTLALVARGLPPTTVVHFLQSESAENGGAGTPFGDGLLCVGGTIRRLAVRQASGGVARLGAGDGSTATMSGLGQLPPAGGVRIYQARYRNSASFCTPATFNTTNAVAIAWGG